NSEEEFDLADATKSSYKQKQTTPLHRLLQHIGNIFVPLIPGLVASGLILGIANIIENLAAPEAGVLDPSILETDLFLLLSAIGNLLFGSLGVFVGIYTAREFRGTIVLGGIAGIIIHAPVFSDIGSLFIFCLYLLVLINLRYLYVVIIPSQITTSL